MREGCHETEVGILAFWDKIRCKKSCINFYRFFSIKNALGHKKCPESPSKYYAPVRLQNANLREFTRFRPLKHSKYHAPGRLQNANLREFTRFRPLRLSKHDAPRRLQNANLREFTRFRPLKSFEILSSREHPGATGSLPGKSILVPFWKPPERKRS